MSNLTTKHCKQAIVDFLMTKSGLVEHEVVVSQQEALEAFKVCNWKRMSKRREGSFWIREFDCEPFDDQLRAIVKSTDTHVIDVTVQGE
jgi:hypothetical protein